MLQQFKSLLQHGKRSFGSLGAVRLFLLLAQQISQLPAGSKPAVTICFIAGTQAVSRLRAPALFAEPGSALAAALLERGRGPACGS